MTGEKVTDLDAIRDRVKAARRDGEYSYGEEAQEHVADLLALLDEAQDLLLDVYTAKGNEDWFDRRDTFLDRFPAPSPTDDGD